MIVLGATVSMVQVRVAGVGSGFPAASTALTWNVWAPWERPKYVFGELQLCHSAESMRHSKPSNCDSAVEKVKLGVGSLDWPEGPETSVVSGAVVSVSWNLWTRLLPWSTM